MPGRENCWGKLDRLLAHNNGQFRIANSRLLKFNEKGGTRWKDYRAKPGCAAKS